ncbi:DUF5906 domain-containing protein [Weissella tructae]|uniref:DUF5906 domain-containing protein n=1 Tax=Weissella tructae TaxID=887702 RepID=UPI001BDD2406|nr:DUF5906 domain-containing protein [Weissella tructae]QVV90846.1 hypothetical protein KHQ32_04225 [Weissella tructae]
MASDLQITSVANFNRLQIPFSTDDEYNNPLMNTEFIGDYEWLELSVTKEGFYKYKISSVIAFAEWLIASDNIAVKDDWGYIWNGSFWERVPVKQVFNMVDVTITALCDRLKISTPKKRELQRDVKPYLVEKSRKFDDSIKDDYIAFKNYTLNVNTNNFFTPVKDYNIIHGFDFEPKANELPETWVAYAEYMFGANAKYLWAWLGYAFQANMSWKQGALFLLDPIGGTGKTYFVTKITGAMFGNNRIGAFKLKNLQGNNARFETARFVGKSLMIDDDASRVRFKEDDTFKSITGGGWSPVERKGIDGTDYRITAKMIVNVNEMPTFNDSGAIKRRLHIIKTVAPVVDGKPEEKSRRDQLFPEYKLQQEIPMLATYAIEQYQEAVKHNWTIEGNIVDDIVALDPFTQWVDKYLSDPVYQGERKSNELYKQYCDYYDSLKLGENERPMSSTAFGKKMSERYIGDKRRDGKYYFIK